MGTWTADIQAAFQEEDRAKLSTGGKKMTIYDRMRGYLDSVHADTPLTDLLVSVLLEMATLVDEALAEREVPRLTLSMDTLMAGARPKEDVPPEDDEPLDRQAFIEGYAKRSGLTVEQLHNMGQEAYPCDCGEPGCKEWLVRDGVSPMDRALEKRHAPSGAAPVPYTYFLIRCDANGATHVTEHDEEGLLEVIRLLRPVKSTVGYSDTSEWGEGFLVIRGEIARLNPRYTTSFPRRPAGWEID